MNLSTLKDKEMWKIMPENINKFFLDSIWTANNDGPKPDLSEHLKFCRLDNDKNQFLYVYKPRKPYIDLDGIKSFVKFLHTIPIDIKGKSILPIFIDLQDVCFADKLVYVMMETIIHYLIENKNWLVTVQGTIKPENCSNGVNYSSLTYGNWSISTMSKKTFKDTVSNENCIRRRYYKYNRKETDELSYTRFFVNQTNNINNIASDIYSFFNNSSIIKSIEKDKINCLFHTIMEMISNSTEHAQSPYIYDIDLRKVTHQLNADLQGKEYIAINVALWDFSNVRIGDAIKRKIHIIDSLSPTDDKYIEQIGLKGEIYKKLLTCYHIHNSFWDQHYTEDEFFALAAFQPGITGRANPGSTGGAGLSHVLDFLFDYPDNYRCYCLTGDTIINLNKDYLLKDTDKWYSFTKNGFFSSSKPCEKCITKSNFFYPGTAFFLHLELN